jgi:hypothetical protein
MHVAIAYVLVKDYQNELHVILRVIDERKEKIFIRRAFTNQRRMEHPIEGCCILLAVTGCGGGERALMK